LAPTKISDKEIAALASHSIILSLTFPFFGNKTFSQIKLCPVFHNIHNIQSNMNHQQQSSSSSTRQLSTMTRWFRRTRGGEENAKKDKKRGSGWKVPRLFSCIIGVGVGRRNNDSYTDDDSTPLPLEQSLVLVSATQSLPQVDGRSDERPLQSDERSWPSDEPSSQSDEPSSQSDERLDEAAAVECPCPLDEAGHGGSSVSVTSKVDTEDEGDSFTTTKDTEEEGTSVVATPAPTPSTPWGSKMSFKDTLLKGQQQQKPQGDKPQEPSSHLAPRKKCKPKIVVVETKKATRQVHSPGPLQAEEDVLGETDAQMYYNQKAQGQLGRQNGRKQRPDEAKRLEMTMAKKSMQRARGQ
jgi:hypothetical protein